MNDYIKTHKVWLTIIYLPKNSIPYDIFVITYLPKKAPYLNPNERKINQQIKSYVCANRFYENIEDQKTAVSEYLNKRFGRWIDSGLCYDTWLIYQHSLRVSRIQERYIPNVICVNTERVSQITAYIYYHRHYEFGFNIWNLAHMHLLNNIIGTNRSYHPRSKTSTFSFSLPATIWRGLLPIGT